MWGLYFRMYIYNSQRRRVHGYVRYIHIRSACRMALTFICVARIASWSSTRNGTGTQQALPAIHIYLALLSLSLYVCARACYHTAPPPPPPLLPSPCPLPRPYNVFHAISTSLLATSYPFSQSLITHSAAPAPRSKSTVPFLDNTM